MALSVIPFSSQDVGKAKGPELVAFSNIELALELNPITQQWMGSNNLKLLCYFRFVQTMHKDSVLNEPSYNEGRL